MPKSTQKAPTAPPKPHHRLYPRHPIHGIGYGTLVHYDELCLICQQEGPHDITDRPHVNEGQE